MPPYWLIAFSTGSFLAWTAVSFESRDEVWLPVNATLLALNTVYLVVEGIRRYRLRLTRRECKMAAIASDFYADEMMDDHIASMHFSERDRTALHRASYKLMRKVPPK